MRRQQAAAQVHSYGTMNVRSLLEKLRSLEVQLHQPQLRSDPARLGELLHPRFIEIGRSGEAYSRAGVLEEFRGRPPDYHIWSQDYQVESIVEGVAVLIYRSAPIDKQGRLERHTIRMSLWEHSDLGWRLRLHQGAPTNEFTKSLP